MSQSSYNGWPASTDPDAIGIDREFAVCGVTFPGGVKAGDAATVLGYLLEQLHRRVEELVPGWCWGYEYRQNVNNPYQLSNHASGTAVDFNAPAHPNGGPAYGGFTDAQVAEVYAILAEVDNTIRWGADFDGTKDPMHFEVNVGAHELAAAATKLRSEGEDMNLSEDDKVWMSEEIRHQLRMALTVDETVSTDDAAMTGNPNKFSIASGIGRAIRLDSLTWQQLHGEPPR